MALADTQTRSRLFYSWLVSQFSQGPIIVKPTAAASIVFEHLQEYCDVPLLLSFKLQEALCDIAVDGCPPRSHANCYFDWRWSNRVAAQIMLCVRMVAYDATYAGPSLSLKKAMKDLSLAHLGHSQHFHRWPDRTQNVIFLDLPAEIRNMVYSNLIMPEDRAYPINTIPSSTTGSVNHPVPPLGQTCQRVRSELLPMFYGQQNFHATLVRPEDVDVTRRWLKKIPDDYQRYFTRLTVTEVLQVVSTVHGSHATRIHYRVIFGPSGHLMQGSGTRISLWKFFAAGETAPIEPWTTENSGTTKKLFVKILDSIEGDWRRSEGTFD